MILEIKGWVTKGACTHALVRFAVAHVRVCGKKQSAKCVRCALVRLVFWCAMYDCTFAHCFEQNDKISCFRMSFPV